jgi:outer membrane autotransporter protein
MNALLSRGGENGVANGPVGALFPLGFAPEYAGLSPFEDALAFATKAPRMPQTAIIADGWRAWIRGSFGRAEFDGTDANFGFRYKTASGEGGIERVNGPWMFGAAFGFGHAKVTQDVTNDNGKLDTIRAGAYASYKPGPWWITAAVAVGLSDIEATRLSALPVAARSNYDATTFSAGIEAARRIQAGHVTIEPNAGFVYTGLRVDSFSETGTTFLDLAGARAHIDALKGYAGGRVYKTLTAANGWAWTPEARGRVLYDFLDDPRGYTARFLADPAATPLPVTGIQPDRFAVMLGAAVTTRFAPAWRTFASYDAEIRGGDLSHLVSAGVKGNW